MNHENEDFNPLDYWDILWNHKALIVSMVGIITIISIIYVLILPPIFQAKASIMPIGGSGKSKGIVSLVSQSGLGGLLGGGALGGQSSAPLKAILESRTLAEQIINDLDLMKILFKEQWDEETQEWIEDEVPHMEDAYLSLTSLVKFQESSKTGLIEIEALSEEPALAAKLANAYINGLTKYLSKNALTASKRKRMFIEKQLSNNRALLLNTGKKISEFYNNKQISGSNSLIDIDVSNEALAMDSWDLLNQETQAKKQELDEKVREMKLVKKVPQQVYLEYLSGYYQLLGQMNALLTQQYEMAKINESKEDISFQVIDFAREPQKKFKPRRRQIVTIVFVLAIFLAVMTVFFIEYIKKMRELVRAH